MRWHSPRDWIADDDNSPGRLSERMTSAGGLWQQLWRATLPLAASQQRPLFDAEREANRPRAPPMVPGRPRGDTCRPSPARHASQAQVVLHQLDGLDARAVLAQLSHAAIEVALGALADSPVVVPLGAAAQDQVSKLAKTARGWDGPPPPDGARAWCERLRALEHAASCVGSLGSKLAGRPELVTAMLTGTHEADVDVDARDALGAALLRAAVPHSTLTGTAWETAPEPEAREYEVSCEARRPAAAAPSAQRMYVGIRPGQCRVAIALSTDSECAEG